MSEHVKTERLEGGALLRVVFERDKGNVLTRALMRELKATLDEHAKDRELKLVVLEGAGKHFSFGASVEEHRADQAQGMLSEFHSLIRNVVRFPVPVAAAVRGRCLGGAFELALACRFVFAEKTAIFACPEITLGVFPPVLAALGPARLGAPLTDRLLLTGAELSADAAFAAGFVTEIASGDDAFSTAHSFYQKHFAPLSAFALRQANEALRRGAAEIEAVGPRLSNIERLYVDRLLPSHDGNEGIAAFLEKRGPEWRHT